MADIHVLRDVTPAEAAVPQLLNVPKLLRDLADAIDAGDHGIREAKEAFGEDIVLRIALVMRVTGQEPLVFGFGDAPLSVTYMDLHAGAQELMAMRHPER
jgi:hypothetical protein